MKRLIRSSVTLSGIIALVSAQLVGILAFGAVAQDRTLQFAPGTEPFAGTWGRTDLPVQQGDIGRTWMWGPEANTDIIQERYAEATDGMRTVQYFDKARMEINDLDADPQSVWFVTNGLLVVELMAGQMQVGSTEFVSREAAQINVSGDADDPDSPTYSSYAQLLDLPALDDGSVITQTVSRAGEVGDEPSLSEYNVQAEYLAPETGHRVASVFWSFMNSEGLVYQGGSLVTDELFLNPFFATGLPLTEAYWAQVDVGGTERWVLTQAFERRVLTFTPGNPDGFLVEAGNVGQHYYAWRYGDEPIYMKSPWWPYLSAHIDDPDPMPVVGGPITVTVTQEDGAANWVFPGPRELDPTVFGTAENPRGTEVPPVIFGVPEMIRTTNDDGSQVTSVPTPFSDSFASTDGASLTLTAVDATATDGASTNDTIALEAIFQAPEGQGEYRVVVNMAAPHGWFVPTAGGVITNFIQHGITGWGTRLMPTEYADVAFWGMGDIYKDGELVAEGRLVHGMVTELVRSENYELAFDSEVNPDHRHFHLIIPPFTPQGEQSPVTTGFMLPGPEGTPMEQPFMHVMFPNITSVAEAPLFEGELPAELLGPAPEMPMMPPPDDAPYMQSPWWPYLSAHVGDEDPFNPIAPGFQYVYQATQEDGASNWILPSPRDLDPNIFGTPNDPQATEVPPMMLGMPEMARETRIDGTQMTGPSPFGDVFATTDGASLAMTVIDATATDAAMTNDRIAFDATFQAPEGQGEYRVVVGMAAPHGWFAPTAGGVATNIIQHGVTKWGTQLMPTEYVDAAFWGMGTIYKDGQVIAENRLVHVMVTEMVRGEKYELAFDDEVDPGHRHLHIIVPPFTPFGAQDPVTTGFMLPNGMEQPFLHVMFPNIEAQAGMLPPTE